MSELLHDHAMLGLLACFAATLLGGSVVTLFVRQGHARVTLRSRLTAWLSMILLYFVILATGTVGASVLFGIVSFLALREFVTLSQSARADHRSLIWAFFILTPLQYVLVARGDYQLYSVLIPVAGFIVISARNATIGDVDRFLERTASIQWALLACVYCISYVPALLTLQIDGYEHPAKLLLYFVSVVQIGDLAESLIGEVWGRRPLSNHLRTRRTWEGLLGGIALATVVGATLWWATPFNPLQAAGMSFVAAVLGSLGGLVMSAIKRDRGRDKRALIRQQGGILYGVDSIVFSAPVFYFLTRVFFT